MDKNIHALVTTDAIRENLRELTDAVHVLSSGRIGQLDIEVLRAIIVTHDFTGNARSPCSAASSARSLISLTVGSVIGGASSCTTAFAASSSALAMAVSAVNLNRRSFRLFCALSVGTS